MPTFPSLEKHIYTKNLCQMIDGQLVLFIFSSYFIVSIFGAKLFFYEGSVMPYDKS